MLIFDKKIIQLNKCFIYILCFLETSKEHAINTYENNYLRGFERKQTKSKNRTQLGGVA